MNDLINEINKLKNLFEQFRTIYFFIKDKEGRYVYANSAFVDFVGVGMSFIYDTAIDIFSETPRQMEKMTEDDQKLLSGEKEFVDRLVSVYDYSKEKVSIRIIKVPLRNKKEVVGILCIGINITEVKNGVDALFARFLAILSGQEKQYFWKMSRKLKQKDARKEIAREMGIEEEHGDKIKSEMMKKLDLREKPKEAESILLLYKIFFDVVVDEDE